MEEKEIYLCLPRIELRIVEYRFYNTLDDNFKPFLYEGHTGWAMSNSAHGTTDFSGNNTGWNVKVLAGQKALYRM